MALNPGSKLGPYEIRAPLGAGGMGEVYRARDTKLNRDVALKVLPETFASDPQRMARFEREAQVLASLNHTNIATIHGLEESGETRALVMELIEGPTLAEVVGARRGVPVHEALPLAKQIAEALEYAHERGIIHRDLKPANIKVTAEGTVKILDFGLAKALDPLTLDPPPRPPAGRGWPAGLGGGRDDVMNSPTLTSAATQAGMILGTAAYMSPEQAKGKSVDRRADIWAFGCVLYEMLAGRRAFEGESTTDTLASVIKSEPDWEALPSETPPHVKRLLNRCLAKDPKQRLQAIGEARIAIEETLSGADTAAPLSPLLTEEGESVSRRSGGARPPLRALPWVIAAGVALIVGVAAGWWAGSRRGPSGGNWSAQMLGGPSFSAGPRSSPDGHTLAFQAMVDQVTQVAVMDVESGEWSVLTKNRSNGFVTELNWSPNGSEIYFDREFSVPHGVYSVSRFGGDERLILNDALSPEVLPDGSLLVSRVNADGIFQMFHFWPEGGRLEPLNAFFPQSSDFAPPVRVFRDGKEAVYFGKAVEHDSADPSSHLYVIDLASGKSRRLAPELNLRMTSALPLFPLAVAADDRSVLVDLTSGDLHCIVSIPRDGSGPVRTVLPLTLSPLYLDVDKEGNIYLDQLDRPYEALRFPVAGGTPESLAGTESTATAVDETLYLPDGRVVFESVIAGKSELLAMKPGSEPAPFIQTKEGTNAPACRLGDSEIAFRLFERSHWVVAIASIADGRIVRRLNDVPGNEVKGLAASPDGKTLYYVAAKTIWAIPAEGGQPRRIAPGDAVSADPNGRDLIVQRLQKEGIRLIRVPVSGGAEQPISFQGALRQTQVFVGPNAVAKDGRVLLTVASADSWFYVAAVLDPRTGKVDRVPLEFAGDVLEPGWLDDGRILAAGKPTKSTLWRFRPAVDGNQ